MSQKLHLVNKTWHLHPNIPCKYIWIVPDFHMLTCFQHAHPNCDVVLMLQRVATSPPMARAPYVDMCHFFPLMSGWKQRFYNGRIICSVIFQENKSIASFINEWMHMHTLGVLYYLSIPNPPKKGSIEIVHSSCRWHQVKAGSQAFASWSIQHFRCCLKIFSNRSF